MSPYSMPLWTILTKLPAPPSPTYMTQGPSSTWQECACVCGVGPLLLLGIQLLAGAVDCLLLLPPPPAHLRGDLGHDVLNVLVRLGGAAGHQGRAWCVCVCVCVCVCARACTRLPCASPPMPKPPPPLGPQAHRAARPPRRR